jgi:hypothetical protein
MYSPECFSIGYNIVCLVGLHQYVSCIVFVTFSKDLYSIKPYFSPFSEYYRVITTFRDKI